MEQTPLLWKRVRRKWQKNILWGNWGPVYYYRDQYLPIFTNIYQYLRFVSLPLTYNSPWNIKYRYMLEPICVLGKNSSNLPSSTDTFASWSRGLFAKGLVKSLGSRYNRYWVVLDTYNDFRIFPISKMGLMTFAALLLQSLSLKVLTHLGVTLGPFPEPFVMREDKTVNFKIWLW